MLRRKKKKKSSSSDWSDRTSRQGATSLGRATTFHTDHCWSEKSRHNFNSERKFSLPLPTELTLTTTHSHHIYTWQTWSLFIFSTYTIHTYIEGELVLQFKLCNRLYTQRELVAQKLVQVKLDPFSNQFQPRAPSSDLGVQSCESKLDLNFWFFLGICSIQGRGSLPLPASHLVSPHWARTKGGDTLNLLYIQPPSFILFHLKACSSYTPFETNLLSIKTLR